MLPIHSNSCVKSWKAKYNKSEKKYPLCINKYNWEGIDFSSETDDWNNITFPLNVLCTPKEKIYPTYVSKYNSQREEEVILWMIPNGENWHYLAV